MSIVNKERTRVDCLTSKSEVNTLKIMMEIIKKIQSSQTTIQ